MTCVSLRQQTAGRFQVRNLFPHGMPVRHPRTRKLCLWLGSLVGGILCAALIATGLAPSPGHHRELWEAVLGVAGLLGAAWIGVFAYRIPVGPVSDAMKHMQARARARRLVEKDPVLATELGIGRPDLSQLHDDEFDDGGLIDVNHVPASWLATLPGLNDQLAAKIMRVRDGVGGFTSTADLEVTLDLPPGRLDEVKDRLLFRTIR
jgi:Helix-hairpin-helix motif